MKPRSDKWLRVPLAVAALAGCATADPTTAVVDNGYAAHDADPSTDVTAYKAWWSVALFPEPVAAGQSSDPIRVVPGNDFAYALLAPGWDPATGSTPASLIPVQTTQRISVDRGETLHILLSDSTTIGNCASGRPLSTEEAAFIVDRIFPGDFAGVVYDPSTCVATPIAEDAGTDARDAAGDEPSIGDGSDADSGGVVLDGSSG